MWTIYKSKERIQKFKETGDSRYISQKELDYACFQHEMAYGDFKDLTKRATSNKILHNKAFIITKNLKYDRYQPGIASMVYKFFDKTSASIADQSVSSSGIKSDNISNKELAE